MYSSIGVGSIYKATQLHTRQVVALKVQYVNHECPTNRYERHFYPLLQGGIGMPRLFASGVEGAWDYLAIDLLGPSLDNLYRKSGKETMDLRSVCSIAIQVVCPLFPCYGIPRIMMSNTSRLGACSSCISVVFYTAIYNWATVSSAYHPTIKLST